MEFLEKEKRAYSKAKSNLAEAINQAFVDLLIQNGKQPIILSFDSQQEIKQCLINTYTEGQKIAPDKISLDFYGKIWFGFKDKELDSYRIDLCNFDYIFTNFDALEALYIKAKQTLKKN